MAMPDGVDALLALAAAPRDRLTRTAYNLGAFNPSAQGIFDVVSAAFPGAAITWKTDVKRQGIVDSWPEDVDDSAARRDWGFAPVFDFRRAFEESLIPRPSVPGMQGAELMTRGARATFVTVLVAVLAGGGCLKKAIPMATSEQAAAETYVRLVLALGRHDEAFVDAYYGPEALRTEVAEAAWSLEDINKRAAVLEVDLRRLPRSRAGPTPS